MNKKEKIKQILHGDKAGRVYLCSKSFFYFCLYYFPEYFTYKLAPFHYDMHQDIKDLESDEINELMWCMFRESAKTSIIKLYCVWCICYKKKRFICIDSHDGDNSEEFVSDIADYLIENEEIIRDFGNLYYEDNPNAKKTKDRKTIKNFDTTNKIKVRSVTTQQSARGFVKKHNRPDLVVFDDFETAKTVKSIVTTETIADHISELKGGVGSSSKIIYLCNYISWSGTVNYLMGLIRDNDKARLRMVNVEDDGITWPDKYVKTNEEADDVNQGIEDKFKRKVSLEEKRASLGDTAYETEMMNNPAKSGDLYFDQDRIKRDLKEVRDPIEIIGDFKIWQRYNPKNNYGIGADTSEGNGNDHNASVCMDFGRTPALVVGTYMNNHISPDLFGYEMIKQGNLFGQCILSPELSNTGYSTLTNIKNEYPIDKIYSHEIKDKKTNKATKSLGWRPTGKTVYEIASAYQTAYNNGEIEIWDSGLLEEMKIFTNAHLEDIAVKRQRLKDNKLNMTNHFDKLKAAMIAWETRKQSKVQEPKKLYKQPAHKSTSVYEG